MRLQRPKETHRDGGGRGGVGGFGGGGWRHPAAELASAAFHHVEGRRTRAPLLLRKGAGSAVRFVLILVLSTAIGRLSVSSFVGPVAEVEGSEFRLCPLNQCWDNYYTEIEALGIVEDFHDQQQHRHRKRQALAGVGSTEDGGRRATLCALYRAFASCVHNATSSCLGDLNFHSTMRGVDRKLSQYGCLFVKHREDAQDAEAEEGKNRQRPTDRKPEAERSGGEQTECVFRKSNVSSYRHCAMHGDPHLRTFDGQHQTCRVQGAWPLIDNDFLTVQITSASVGMGEGTSISKVTVVIKRNRLCALDRYVTYQAQGGELPGSFDDGQMEFNSVEIFEYSPGRHVEIDIGYRQTIIIVRLTAAATYSVSVSMPEDVDDDYAAVPETEKTDRVVQLCRTGCPVSERVDLGAYVGQKAGKLKRTVVMARKEATDKCRGLGLDGFYVDSCVYDLMTTGDEAFTVAAQSSYSDLLRFIPSAKAAEQRNGSTASGGVVARGGKETDRTISPEVRNAGSRLLVTYGILFPVVVVLQHIASGRRANRPSD